MKLRTSIILISVIVFLITGMNQNLASQVPAQDSLALVALYDNTDGANWTTNTGWLTTEPISTWFGIVVSDGRVTGVSLGSNNLSGTMPPEIGDLTGLTSLILNFNQINGSIPPEIGNLTNLRDLQLTSNQFTGLIPDEIYLLTNLLFLRLESNELEGSISSDIGNLVHLVSLFLSDNLLTDSIPAEIGNLENLVTLHLRFNQLSGSIPIEVYNLTTLVTINLSINQLEGTIPTQIGNLVNLTEYSVPGNNMHGNIPVEIGNLVKLKHLWLYGNDFEGAVPSGIGNMPALLFLRLENNQLTHLPDISADTSLTNTQIQNNRFTFEDIEPNVGIEGIIYSPQDSVGDEQDVVISQDSSLVLSVAVDGTANQYQWTKDGVVIQDATDSSYTIIAATATDEGSYVCKITNTIAIELTLYSRAINVEVAGVVGIEDQLPHVPETFSLNQNYPNPFNPSTIISYQLPQQSNIELVIYNMAGQIVTSLVSEQQSAGSYQYEWNAGGLASGVYFYRITAGEFVKVKKLLLLK